MLLADETALIARAKNDDQRAFTALLDPIRDRLWAVCLRTTRSQHDAEDALQDALIAIWQHLPRFRGDASIATWAFRIAANSALAVVRRRREVTVSDDFSFELPDDGDSDDDFAESHAERDRVQRALAELGEDFRVAIVLREYAGYSYEQIADYQGVPVQTVRSRLNRARKRLRELLAAEPGTA